jgi:hypothetical protein
MADSTAFDTTLAWHLRPDVMGRSDDLRSLPAFARTDAFLAHTNIFLAVTPRNDAVASGQVPVWAWPVIAVAILALVAAGVLAYCLAHRNWAAFYYSE